MPVRVYPTLARNVSGPWYTTGGCMACGAPEAEAPTLFPAAETEELLTLFNQWQVRAGVRLRRLEKVWKAVEWWDSADRTEDAVKAALAEYRNDHGTTPPP